MPENDKCFTCDRCHNTAPKTLEVFRDDRKWPEGAGGSFCASTAESTGCAEIVLAETFLHEMPDYETARKGFEVGALAQKHLEILNERSKKMAEGVLSGKGFDGSGLPEFEGRQSLLDKARKIVQTPAQRPGDDGVLIGVGHFLPGSR